MTLSRQHADAAAGGQQRGVSFHFKQDFTGEDVEKLLRFFVVVANFGRARWHELLDYAELVIVDQVPGVAIISPTIVFCIAAVHQAGRACACIV
jgi:hypothetical protein